MNSYAESRSGTCIDIAVICFRRQFYLRAAGRYAAVSERTQEIGILKALGGSSFYIFSLLFQEALLISILGTTFRIAMAYGTKWLVAHALPIF